MIIFLNGSINAGKTTIGKLLAEKLDMEFLDFDDISKTLPDFDLDKDLPKVFAEGISTINKKTQQEKNVVAGYVVRRKDYERLSTELDDKDLYLFTLAPKLEIALNDRGGRKLTQWEVKRVQYHYNTGVSSPDFGVIIDNSDLSPEETVQAILDTLKDKPGNKKQTLFK